MKVSAEVKAQVEAKLKECITTATRSFPEYEFKMPTILYTKRGTTAGTATLQRWTVNYNSTLLMENIEDFLNRTVPHEMAHLIDFKVNPRNFQPGYGRKRSVHGTTWKNIMRILGAPTTRCHSFDTTNSRVKKRAGVKQVYSCNTCQLLMKLGPVRHRKMQSGANHYWMRGCRGHGGYTYVGVDQPVPAQIAAQAPATPKDPGTPKVSKLTSCRALYDWTESRQHNINLFVGAGCTTAGAATYYQKIKNESA